MPERHPNPAEQQAITAERQPNSKALVFGLVLIGLGGTAALAAQTGLSLVQAGSIMLLLCAAILFSFLVDRARGTNENPGPR